jgi:hypothetical protein
MRTIKDDFKRKAHFEAIIENYYSHDVCGDYPRQLNDLSKIDLIRLVNYLHLYIGGIYVDVNGQGKLSLFEV